MIGYEVEEETRDFEQEGITKNITQFNLSEMKYPNIIIHGDVKDYQGRVLKALILTDNEVPPDEKLIYLYYQNEEGQSYLGSLMQAQVRAVFNIFDGNEIDGYFDANTKLEGDMIYVLI